MNRAFPVFVALLFLLTFSARAESPVYTVGAILPLTGEAAAAGSACRNAMQMAYQEIDSDLRERVVLLFEDNSFAAGKAVNAYRKLRDVDRANVILTWDSSSSNALAPLTEQAGVVLLTQSLDPRIVAGRRFAFNFWVTPEAQAEAMIKESLRRGYRRIARITALHDALLSIKQAFDRINAGRLEIVLDEEIATDTRDFRPFLTRLRTLPPVDAMFENVLMGGQVGTLARQSREMGFNMSLFGPESFETVEDVKISNGALTGQWYVQASNPSGDFVNRFRSRFPDSSLYSIGNCYDIVGLVAAALREGTPLRDFLESLKDFNGVMGRISSTGDHRFTLSAVVKRITADGFENLTP